MSNRSPFVQLFLARMREFVREPGVLFWVFGFPILLAVGLGIAFRNKPADVIAVGVIDAPGSERVVSALQAHPGFRVEKTTPEQAQQHLRLGRVAIVVVPGDTYEYRFDPTRPDSVLARREVHDALENAAGRTDPIVTRETLVTEPGARYIDFLIPGLLGMNIMSGGMWGVGYVIVEMRSRKLLKRLIATPMRRTDFLAAMIASRMVVVFVEMGLMLLFGWLAFDLVLQGSLWLVTLLSLLGALSFSALGLAVASRTAKTEVVSGLMNLAMLPMFVVSGVFFSSDRFPAVFQPLIKALPLTALNDALRAVILEGEPFSAQLSRIAVLLAWGAVSFVLALRFFRWN
jgi:ABC transporter DrrB family efflux protein